MLFGVAPYVPIDEHAQLTGLSSAKGIGVPLSASGVIIQALGQNVRLKMSGTPTSSSGFQIRAGDPPVLIPLQSQRSIQVIQELASATVEYQFVQILTN